MAKGVYDRFTAKTMISSKVLAKGITMWCMGRRFGYATKISKERMHLSYYQLCTC